MNVTDLKQKSNTHVAKKRNPGTIPLMHQRLGGQSWYERRKPSEERDPRPEPHDIQKNNVRLKATPTQASSKWFFFNATHLLKTEVISRQIDIALLASLKSKYERFNCNNFSIRNWSWNYRGCWHQTCPPVDPR